LQKYEFPWQTAYQKIENRGEIIEKRKRSKKQEPGDKTKENREERIDNREEKRLKKVRS